MKVTDSLIDDIIDAVLRYAECHHDSIAHGGTFHDVKEGCEDAVRKVMEDELNKRT